MGGGLRPTPHPLHSHRYRFTYSKELVDPGELLGYSDRFREDSKSHGVLKVVGLAAVGKGLKEVLGCLQTCETFLILSEWTREQHNSTSGGKKLLVNCITHCI